MSFAKEVFTKLSAIDCDQYTDKKQNLTYLAWASAWQLLMNEYPESYFEFDEEKVKGKGTVEVSCTITIKDGEKELKRSMWLPVLSYNNKSILEPDSYDLNKAKMRCLVKAMALCGLGLYIYAKEDKPEVRAIDEMQLRAIFELEDYLGVSGIEKNFQVAIVDDLTQEQAERAISMLRKLRKHQDSIDYIRQLFDSGDKEELARYWVEEIDSQMKNDFRIAPTKGGPFSTELCKFFKEEANMIYRGKQ